MSDSSASYEFDAYVDSEEEDGRSAAEAAFGEGKEGGGGVGESAMRRLADMLGISLGEAADVLMEAGGDLEKAVDRHFGLRAGVQNGGGTRMADDSKEGKEGKDAGKEGKQGTEGKEGKEGTEGSDADAAEWACSICTVLNAPSFLTWGRRFHESPYICMCDVCHVLPGAGANAGVDRAPMAEAEQVAAITGCSLPEAGRLLTATGNDLASAIELHFAASGAPDGEGSCGDRDGEACIDQERGGASENKEEVEVLESKEAPSETAGTGGSGDGDTAGGTTTGDGDTDSDTDSGRRHRPVRRAPLALQLPEGYALEGGKLLPIGTLTALLDAVRPLVAGDGVPRRILAFLPPSFGFESLRAVCRGGWTLIERSLQTILTLYSRSISFPTNIDGLLMSSETDYEKWLELSTAAEALVLCRRLQQKVVMRNLVNELRATGVDVNATSETYRHWLSHLLVNG